MLNVGGLRRFHAYACLTPVGRLRLAQLDYRRRVAVSRSTRSCAATAVHCRPGPTLPPECASGWYAERQTSTATMSPGQRASRRHQEARPHPEGGGWRIVGRQAGRGNSGQRGNGDWYIHNAVNDHTRLGDSEPQTNGKVTENSATAHPRSCGPGGGWPRTFIWRIRCHAAHGCVAFVISRRTHNDAIVKFGPRGRVSAWSRTSTERQIQASPQPLHSSSQEVARCILISQQRAESMR